ncbi:hypothetical protein TNCV_1663481 [Trichonephila clavipes]|nr:hypothetical protein TNCV_1663481 [Trichonephila clavipes]
MSILVGETNSLKKSCAFSADILTGLRSHFCSEKYLMSKECLEKKAWPSRGIGFMILQMKKPQQINCWNFR